MTNNSEKPREYACIRLDGQTHITVSGSECACGKKYTFNIPEPENTLIVKSPLLWLTLPEVTCEVCRLKIISKEPRR